MWEGGTGEAPTSRDAVEYHRKLVSSIIGAEFDPTLARTIGTQTSYLKRISGGSKEMAEIGRKLQESKYVKLSGRTKNEDIYSHPDGGSIVSVKQQGRNSLLINHVVDSRPRQSPLP